MNRQDLAICGECSRQYDLRSKLKDLDLYTFQRDAHDFARECGIDLPAAYSVLLGITALEKVQDMLEQNPASGKVSFDRSFADAVAAGRLSPQQAAMRGKREAFAEKLVQRHRITMEQALDVADNKIPLLEAVHRNERVETIEFEPPRPGFPYLKLFLAAGTTLALIAAAIVVVITQYPDVNVEPIRQQKVASKSSRVIASLQEVVTDVVYDDNGLATEVTGGNPRVVLDTYCRSVKGFKAEPVSLQAAGKDWNGLYRSRGVLYSIRIRWDASRLLWVTGNAEDWVRGEPVPPSR
jgi:hypothetical protein